MKALVTFLAVSLFSLSIQAIEATHGMVLFGQDKLMAYHLPMFHKIHARQVIFEYTVSPEIKSRLQSFGENALLTFVPAPFDLDKFLAAPHELKGDVYLGHFEKDGVVVMSDVTMLTPKVVYQNGISKEVGNGLANTYKLVGTASDLYIVHLLDGGTQIDQIFKGSVAPQDQPKLNPPSFDLIKTTEGELKEGDLTSTSKSYETSCRLSLCPIRTITIPLTVSKLCFADSVY